MGVIDIIEINGVQHDLCGCTVHEKEQRADLTLTDAEDNVLVEFADGHIRTRNYDSRKNTVKAHMERGGFVFKDGSFDYTIGSFENYVRTSYMIKTNGAKYISLHKGIKAVVYQFDVNYKKIKVSICADGDVSPLDSLCMYIRCEINSKEEWEWLDVMLYASNEIPCEVKNVQIRPIAERLVFKIAEGVCTTARLMLPTNYSINGNKVPLVIWDAGDGSFINWNDEIYASGSIGPNTNLDYLRDQAIAVLTIYGWGSKNYEKYPRCGMGTGIPIPTVIAAHEKGVEYVTSRFNIDKENIHHISKSGGGKIGLYYAIKKSPIQFKSLYAFSPVIDGLCFNSWGAGFSDYRNAIHDDMHFEGDTTAFLGRDSWSINTPEGQAFIKENAGKFTCSAVNWIGLTGQTIEEKVEDSRLFSSKFWDEKYYNSPKRVDIYTRNNLSIIAEGAPIMIFGSPIDSGCPYLIMKEVVDQLKNGGHEAKMVTLREGGHVCADFMNPVNDVTTRLGVFWKEVPIGWYTVVEEIYARFVK